MKNLPLILCIGCKKSTPREKMIDYEFCWSCIGVTNKEEAASVKCVESKIVKQEKPKKSSSWLTIWIDCIVVNVCFVFNNFYRFFK